MVSQWAETAVWVLVGVSIVLIFSFGALRAIEEWTEFQIPSFAYPWQNLLLKTCGVLATLIVFILLAF